MTKILYLEDESFLAKIVKETLEKEKYEVKHLSDGANVSETFSTFQPDICLFDIMLPNRNGYEIAQDIRKKNTHVPILFLTAKDQTNDLLEGFRVGGNDYIKKPFSLEELIVRIENILNLSNNKNLKIDNNEVIPIGESFVFNPQKFSLEHPNGNRILTNKESQILEMLCENPNALTERKSILLKVWDEDSYFNSRTLDVYIRKLRKYFSIEPDIQIITLKGVGYQFVV